MIGNDRLAEMWLLALAGRLDTKSIGLFWSFQLHFESLHSNLKPVHRLYRGLSTRLVVVAYKSCDAHRTYPLTTHTTVTTNHKEKLFAPLNHKTSALGLHFCMSAITSGRTEVSRMRLVHTD